MEQITNRTNQNFTLLALVRSEAVIISVQCLALSYLNILQT